MTKRKEHHRAAPRMSNRICCWNNCTETAAGDLPQGWVNLFVYESPQPMGAKVFHPRHFDKHRRDGVLCAQHAFMLDRLLSPLPAGANQGVTIVRTPKPPKNPPTVN